MELVRTFGPEDAAWVKARGVHFRKTSGIYALPIPSEEDVRVETAEGPIQVEGRQGTFLATDEAGTRVWPIDAAYMAANYEEDVP